MDAENGQPLKDARVVTIYWMDNTGFQPQTWKSSADGSISLWNYDPQTHDLQQRVIGGHPSRVWTLSLSRDEQLLASGDEEGTTLLIDTGTGQVIEKISVDRPYERMNIRGVSGLNAAERAAFNALGAVEAEPSTRA